MRLDRILETALYVDDLDRASAFYETVMGLARRFGDDRLRAYDVGGRSVLLLFRRGASLEASVLPGGRIPPHDGAGPAHMAFGCDDGDLAAWESRLAEHGVAIESRVAWQPGGRSLYFRDPDGHALEIATPGIWATY